MFSDVVMGIPKPNFEKIIDAIKEEKGVGQDTQLDAATCGKWWTVSRRSYLREKGEEFPRIPGCSC
jgi:pyruvate,orthophosphate dikinase